jgi:pyruvate formate lyase activating enzyme
VNGDPDTRGVIFNVQRYSIHDGPGIRTTVFLKGCPLRCLWCQNPESQINRPELFFDATRCGACGACVAACAAGAISVRDGRSWTDRTLCNGAGACVDVCPNDARTLMGRYVTAAEVFDEVEADRVFYEGSGGGVTLSGGDPVSQPRFAASLLRLCKDAGLHTALDTSGHTRWNTLAPLLAHADLVLYDLKHMDPDAHTTLTGSSNEWILDNARRIVHEAATPMLVRLPVVPGCNDTVENVEATARFVAHELDPSIPVHLLPYHRLGVTKHERLEHEGGFDGEPASDEHVEELRTIVESFGLTAVIGG